MKKSPSETLDWLRRNQPTNYTAINAVLKKLGVQPRKKYARRFVSHGTSWSESQKPAVPFKPLPVVKKTLTARNEFISGTADFEKRDNVWGLVRCDESLAFLCVTPYDKLKLDLIRRGMTWDWS